MVGSGVLGLYRGHSLVPTYVAYIVYLPSDKHVDHCMCSESDYVHDNQRFSSLGRIPVAAAPNQDQVIPR